MPQAETRHITPQLPRALPKPARVKVERAIEAHQDAAQALLAFLNEIDGDADYEDGGDGEPSLGSRGETYDSDRSDQTLWATGGVDDREVDVGDEGEDGADDDLSCEDAGAPSNMEAI